MALSLACIVLDLHMKSYLCPLLGKGSAQKEAAVASTAGSDGLRGVGLTRDVKERNHITHSRHCCCSVLTQSRLALLA